MAARVLIFPTERARPTAYRRCVRCTAFIPQAGLCPSCQELTAVDLELTQRAQAKRETADTCDGDCGYTFAPGSWIAYCQRTGRALCRACSIVAGVLS